METAKMAPSFANNRPDMINSWFYSWNLLGGFAFSEAKT